MSRDQPIEIQVAAPRITAAMLYDLATCPHRVTMDLFANPAERDPPNPFVELLWERGTSYEREAIAGLHEPFVDLSPYAGDEKVRLTLEAMRRGERLIYSGRIQIANLLGEPDLLRRQGTGYIAGDIKSGSGEEGGEEDSKPKIRYAVQLGLYTDALERIGLSAARRAFVWDIHGDEVPYDFQTPYGKRNPRTLWQDYEEALGAAEAIVSGTEKTLPAYFSGCKLCHWYSACVKRVKDTDDLTMIPELGRTKRDTMHDRVHTVSELANLSPETFVVGKKTTFPGIGPDMLMKFHERAKLLTSMNATPYSHVPITLPSFDREIFFDIEVDPLRGICYLHGFIERLRRDNSTEKFEFAFADEATAKAESNAFARAWAYLLNRRPCGIYYYSKYERTIYRGLQQKFPEICSAEEIEELFAPAHAVDLYNDIIRKSTEWPTWDFSIKTLANYLGFSWRDTHPSGAASIEWFHRWIETGDPSVRQRVIDYNEDDCRAMRVLRDALDRLPVAEGVSA